RRRAEGMAHLLQARQSAAAAGRGVVDDAEFRAHGRRLPAGREPGPVAPSLLGGCQLPRYTRFRTVPTEKEAAMLLIQASRVGNGPGGGDVGTIIRRSSAR